MGRRALVLAAVAGLLGTALVLSLVDQRLRAGEDRALAAYVDYPSARRYRLDAIVADGRASAESDPALACLREAAFGDRP